MTTIPSYETASGFNVIDLSLERVLPLDNHDPTYAVSYDLSDFVEKMKLRSGQDRLNDALFHVIRAIMWKPGFKSASNSVVCEIGRSEPFRE